MDPFEVLRLCCICQIAGKTYAIESAWQHVQEEPSDKFRAFDCKFLILSMVRIVFVFERDIIVPNRDDAPVRDGGTVGGRAR